MRHARDKTLPSSLGIKKGILTPKYCKDRHSQTLQRGVRESWKHLHSSDEAGPNKTEELEKIIVLRGTFIVGRESHIDVQGLAMPPRSQQHERGCSNHGPEANV